MCNINEMGPATGLTAAAKVKNAMYADAEAEAHSTARHGSVCAAGCEVAAGGWWLVADEGV